MAKIKAHPTDELLKQLGFAGPEPQKSDSLDFRDMAVWEIRDALRNAYDLGQSKRKHKS